MVLLVWLHVLAAVSWIGGMIFLSLVLAPLVRSRKAVPELMALFRSAARRFRFVVWGAIVILLLTGPPLLHQRGIPIMDPSGWPLILAVKLGLVAVLLFFTLTHDLILGPRVGRIVQLPSERRSGLDDVLVACSPWIARSSLVLTLAV
jgi:copper resistance protein D